MTRKVSKGCVVKQEIATVFTTIAHGLKIDGPEAESETFAGRTLDGSVGIPYDPTGYSEGGSLKLECFFDPSLAGHKAQLALITAPAKCNHKLVFSDATEWPYVAAGVKVGPSIDMADGIKANIEHKLDGLVTYPA